MQNIDENSDEEEADDDVYEQAEQLQKNEKAFSGSSSDQEETKHSLIMTRVGRNRSQDRPAPKDLEVEKRIGMNNNTIRR